MLTDSIEKLKKKYKSENTAGTVYKVFEYNDTCSRDESGYLPVIIKPTHEEVEKKKKRSIN